MRVITSTMSTMTPTHYNNGDIYDSSTNDNHDFEKNLTMIKTSMITMTTQNNYSHSDTMTIIIVVTVTTT